MLCEITETTMYTKNLTTSNVIMSATSFPFEHANWRIIRRQQIYNSSLPENLTLRFEKLVWWGKC